METWCEKTRIIYPCNARNLNVHIVNSISHPIKPLNVGKSDVLVI